MNSQVNGVCNLFVNTHELIKIYREFYHCIIYLVNEGRHVRIYCIFFYTVQYDHYYTLLWKLDENK
jgi:hypothetical protein